jgi:hypothetical protein
MKIGEASSGDMALATIDRYSNAIDLTAREFGVSAGTIKAIMYEEQTHTLPIIESDAAELMGVGNTVGMGQVTIGLYGNTRADLIDPATNIRVIGQHLGNLQRQPLIDPNRPTHSLATSYNCGSCRDVSAYGRRVASYKATLFGD